MIDWRTRLVDCLKGSGKTRAEIVTAAGLNGAYLTQILDKKGATPSVDNLQRIAGVLGKTVGYLVDGASMDSEAIELLALFSRLDPGRRMAVLTLMRDRSADLP